MPVDYQKKTSLNKRSSSLFDVNFFSAKSKYWKISSFSWARPEKFDNYLDHQKYENRPSNSSPQNLWQMFNLEKTKILTENSNKVFTQSEIQIPLKRTNLVNFHQFWYHSHHPSLIKKGWHVWSLWWS